MQKTSYQSTTDFDVSIERPISSRRPAGVPDPTFTSWSDGCGSPHPATPLSESRYDGDKPFDDCEPWVL